MLSYYEIFRIFRIFVILVLCNTYSDKIIIANTGCTQTCSARSTLQLLAYALCDSTVACFQYATLRHTRALSPTAFPQKAEASFNINYLSLHTFPLQIL